MKNNWRGILLVPDPGPGPGPGPTPPPAPPTPPPVAWHSTLPDDLKSNPLITGLKSVDDLAKGYVNAQTLIGSKRIAVPARDAKPEVWNEVYNALGRPETFDKYSEPTVKAVEGVTLDNAGLGKAKEVFFGLGLTDTQQRGIMDFYLKGLNDNHTTFNTQTETSRAAADTALKQEWGDKHSANVNVAQAAFKKFASDESLNEMAAGLGNNPAMVKLFFNIGKAMLEDTSLTGGGLDVNSAARANQRISELKVDAVFQKSLNTANDPGHKDAVALWLKVHEDAAEGKKVSTT